MNISVPPNPYATPPSVGPPKPPVKLPGIRSGLLRFARVWTGLMIVGSVPAAFISWMDVESIVVSGPIYFVAGFILLVLGLRPRLRHLLPVAIAVLLFAAAVFFAIVTLGLSPQQAQWPVSAACVAFAVVLQLGWILVAKRHVQGVEPTARE